MRMPFYASLYFMEVKCHTFRSRHTPYQFQEYLTIVKNEDTTIFGIPSITNVWEPFCFGDAHMDPAAVSNPLKLNKSKPNYFRLEFHRLFSHTVFSSKFANISSRNKKIKINLSGFRLRLPHRNNLYPGERLQLMVLVF